MNTKTVSRILSDTAYVRVGGSEEELRCAEYLRGLCADRGLDTVLEPFDIDVYSEEYARLCVDGREIKCKGHFGAASKAVSAPLYYLTSTDKVSLKKCKDKIVLVNKGFNSTLYDMLEANGAKGFITYDGNIYFSDRDIDRKEIRFETDEESLLPGVHIHVSDAVALVKAEASFAEISVKQTSRVGNSHNVILDLDGESDETVVVSAHYDSTSLSVGAYDNMSSCIGLIYLAEYFASRPRKRRLRLLFCGSEERGLIGSYRYCEDHKDELKNTVLNINLDMLGSVMGEFVSFSCADEDMAKYLETFMSKRRFSGSVRYGLRSSDSNSFVYHGVPAVSFARYSPSGTALIHSRYDTSEIVSPKQLLRDMSFIAKFTDAALNSESFPSDISISEKIKTDLVDYMRSKENRQLKSKKVSKNEKY